MADNDLGALSYSLNIDISQIPDTIKVVEKQLSTISAVADVSMNADPKQLIAVIKQALMAEDFKLKVSLDDSFKKVIDSATSLIGGAASGGMGDADSQLGYIESLILKLKELEVQYKSMPKGADTSSLIEEFTTVQAELNKVGKNLSTVLNKSWEEVMNMTEVTVGDIRTKVKSLEQLKLSIPVGNKDEIESINNLISKLKKDIVELRAPKSTRGVEEVLGLDTKSLDQIKEKLKEIRRVRGEINVKDSGGISQINSLNNAEADLLKIQKQRLGVNKQISNSYADQMGLIQRLATTGLAFFSVQKITQFAERVRDTTGEFEKQRIALTAILQSREDANRLFDQVVGLGIKSPFSIMELNGYVRQLSAFQIETEQLFDTTKRLADISAGLNVDMGRLILAYGQVRAAEYLRGQEVRQFTEAGIPIVGKLAEQFSKLEGVSVSVAEVFERISNRGVTFENVKEALWDMTDAGGIFFDMQDKLADSLATKWKNLQDVLDVMYNSIGSEYSESMKYIIELVTELASRWEEVFDAMSLLIGTYGAYRAGVLITTATQKINNLILREAVILKAQNAKNNIVMGKTALIAAAQTNVLSASLTSAEKALKTNKVALIMAAIAALGFAIYKVATHTDAWGKALESVKKEGDKLTASIENEQIKIDRLFGSLDSLTKGTKAYEEQKQAIIDQYGGYLKDLGAEIAQLDNVEAAYRAVSFAAKQSAIDRSIAAKAEDAANTKTKEDEKTIERLRKDIADSDKYKGNKNEREQEAILQTILSDIRSKGELSTEVQELVKSLSRTEIMRGAGTTSGTYASNAVQFRVDDLKKNSSEYEKLLEATEKTLGIQRNDYMKLEYDQVAEHLEAVNKAYEEAQRTGKAQAIKAMRDGKMITMSEIELLSEKKRAEEALLLKSPTAELNLGAEYAKAEAAYLKAKELVNTIKKDKSTYSPKDLEQAEKDLERATVLFRKYGGEIDKRGGGAAKDGPILKRYRDQITLVKEANQAYEDNLKNFGEENAKSNVIADYGQQFEELEVNIGFATDRLAFFEALRTKLASDKSEKGVSLYNDVNKSIAGVNAEGRTRSKEQSWDEINEEAKKAEKAYQLLDSLKGKLDTGLAKKLVSSMYEDVSLEFEDFNAYISDLVGDGSGDWGSQAGKDFKNNFNRESKESFIKLLNDFQTTQDKINAINSKYKDLFGELEKNRTYFTEEAYKERTQLLQESKEQELAAVTATAIQMTEAYQKMFGNIAEMSERELGYIIDTWKEALTNASRNTDGTFSIGLDGKQFTTTEQQLASFTKKVLASEKELRDKNPFKSLQNSIEELRTNTLRRNKLEVELKKAVSDLASLDENSTPELIAELKERIRELEAEIRKLKGESASTWSEMATDMGKVVGEVNDLADSMVSLFEALGGGDDATAALNDIVDIIGGLGDATAGVARIASGDIIGGLAQGIKGVAGVISSITSLSDRKHERQIRRLQDAIDASKIAYEQLGRAAAKALGNAEYDTKKLQIAELKRQQDLIKGQIQSENNKKKTDKGKVSEWENELRQLGYEIEDVITEITDSLRGNLKDMASDIANALVEAFEAGDNAQEAMFKAIKSNIKSAIIDQFQKAVIDKALEPLFKRMDEMLGVDEEGVASRDRFTPEQVLELIAEGDKISKEVMDKFISGGWQDIFDALTNTGELSGLSKGIQGLTEDTAHILEAYLNTIRDVVISIMMVQENQLTVLQASQMIQAQILTEVATAGSATVAMNNAIQSVLAKSQGDKGTGLRVFIQ